MPPAAFRWLLLPFFGWQLWHYQKQNLGMAALAASASRAGPLRRPERGALVLAGLMTVPGLLGLRVSLRATGLFPAAMSVFAAAVLAGAVLLYRRPRAQRPAGFCAAYAACLLFCTPVFVFTSPYAAVGGMTVGHGLQYLAFLGLIAGGGGPRAAQVGPLAVLANIALAGGAVLSAASHLHNGDPPGRLLFGGYLGVVMAHFVVDAGMWRMRDPFTRRFLAARIPFLVAGRKTAGRNPPPPEPAVSARVPGSGRSPTGIGWRP
jgi:hypothetical protein